MSPPFVLRRSPFSRRRSKRPHYPRKLYCFIVWFDAENKSLRHICQLSAFFAFQS